MRCKTKGKLGDVALKIYISKAYDRVDWRYLELMMLRLGFSMIWVRWMMMCITSVHYTILVNQDHVGPIDPSRGLRQGGPLSPYLFLICAEGLSTLIQNEQGKGTIHGVKICRGAPIITHLLFADDCFLFIRANESDAGTMKNILETYATASGQLINMNKSEVFFSRNVQPLPLLPWRLCWMFVMFWAQGSIWACPL